MKSRSNQRKNQSKMNAIKQSLAQLRVETNPIIKPRPTRGNPPPVAAPLDKWHRRTVAIIKQGVATAAADFTLGDIIANLNASSGTTTTIKVLSIKAWNTSLGRGMFATITPSAFMVDRAATIASDKIEFRDYGTGSNLAGAHFNIPDTLALATAPNSSTTTIFLSCSDPNAASGIINNFLVHVSIEFLM